MRAMSAEGPAVMRYEPNRLYCLRCDEQPDYFYKVLDRQGNLVMPDGTTVAGRDLEVLEYRCTECDGIATWGCDVKEDRRKPSRSGGRG